MKKLIVLLPPTASIDNMVHNILRASIYARPLRKEMKKKIAIIASILIILVICCIAVFSPKEVAYQTTGTVLKFAGGSFENPIFVKTVPIEVEGTLSWKYDRYYSWPGYFIAFDGTITVDNTGLNSENRTPEGLLYFGETGIGHFWLPPENRDYFWAKSKFTKAALRTDLYGEDVWIVWPAATTEEALVVLKNVEDRSSWMWFG